MEKIIVETLSVTLANEKIQFQIFLPEDAMLLTGIDVSTNKYTVVNPLLHSKVPHRGVGIIRLFVADDGDCIYSQLLHADASIPAWEQLGIEHTFPELWNQNEPAPPFLTKQFTKATIINGFYEDLVGGVNLEPPNYTVKITLHYEIPEP